ncbi:MAG: hypothetical protein M3317_15785, partial [Actinomycetota bacterium]|nr:hypothetical protein [Actinomycetota bacterium]
AQTRAEENNNQSARQSTQEMQSAEDSVRAAVQDYYAAAATGNYHYTYEQLSSYSKSQFTEDEWVADNTALGSDAATYSIDSVKMVGDSTAEVSLTVAPPGGSSSERTTKFVSENGSWKHELTQPEYDLFANAADNSASASASSSSSPGASASANANAKHVKVVVSSSKPADVSISDDSLDWFLNEQIIGTETYERDIAKNSGLSVTATTDAYNAQTSIQVYENGSLVAQDSDPHGSAIVTY